MVRTKNVEFFATIELPATSSVSSSYTFNDPRAFVVTEVSISERYIIIIIINDK